MKRHHLSSIVLALIAITYQPAAAQSATPGILSRSSASAAWASADDSEAPPTTRMRVENARRRHTEAITELVATFNHLPFEPQLISSKEMVDAVDQGDRALKRTKAACDAILVTLRAEAKTINAEASFSPEQKTELLSAVESMKTDCENLAAQAVASIKQLEGAYKAMGKWRKIYKTYLDLDGPGKANERLKTAVDEYVQGLTTTPAPAESTPADPSSIDPTPEAGSQ